jgi:hypothetical protein
MECIKNIPYNCSYYVIFITSLGIYGLLSTGFQGNIAKLEINNKKIKNIEVKKNRFDEIKVELKRKRGIR